MKTRGIVAGIVVQSTKPAPTIAKKTCLRWCIQEDNGRILARVKRLPIGINPNHHKQTLNTKRSVLSHRACEHVRLFTHEVGGVLPTDFPYKQSRDRMRGEAREGIERAYEVHADCALHGSEPSYFSWCPKAALSKA